MSYPQPDSNAPALNGQNIFRLRTQLVSPGDIYESEQSAFAVAVGPDSDIANLDVTFFDDTISNFVGRMNVSNRAPFIGSVQARNEVTYSPSKVPGRILIAPSDIVPNLTRTSATVMIIPPILDVIQYLSPPSSALLAARNDRYYYFSDYPTGGGSYQVLMPYYGRVYADFRIGGTAGAETARIRGYNYGPGGSSNQTFVDLLAATAIGLTGQHKVISAGVDGMFDYLELTIAGGTGLSIDTAIRFSDIPQ